MTQDELVRQLNTLVHGMSDDITAMLSAIDAYLKSTSPQAFHLAVPWLSQLGDKAAYGSGDCAEACVAMVLRFSGKSIESVDQVSKAAGLPQGFTASAWWDAVKAASAFGVVLEHAQNQTLENITAELEASRPVIALLNYQSIPPALRYSPSYNSGHFVVITGIDDQSVFVHDPYWPDVARGANLAYARIDFIRAWSTKALGNTLTNQALYLRQR